MEAFNGDHYIDQEITDLIKKWKIKTIVETGTFIGLTTRRLSEHGIPVHTIEINEVYYDKLSSVVFPPYVVRHLGSSNNILAQLLPTLDSPILFYLDAHGHGHSTVIAEELGIIASYGLKNSIIAIHDFQVPGKPFGYDSFPEVTLNLPSLYPYISKVYYDVNFCYHYNKKACGENRGIIYIYPNI